MLKPTALEIRVTGTVQGVGFRPTVFRLACEEGLSGEVWNDSAGVLIRAAGSEEALARLLLRLRDEAPPLSHIESIESRPLAGWQPAAGFRISESLPGENRTRVTPDAAVCDACRAEVLGTTDRRSGYPFTNCTHCGPRFSIVTGVPYDRERTTMAPFPMCADCAAEYVHPADRRFHAQPIACPECGPRIWLREAEGQSSGEGRPGDADTPPRSGARDVIAAARACIDRGGIVALRGLGGFHLACDATNEAATLRLRARKHRFGKPFALMVRDIEGVRRYAEVTPLAEELLRSPEAPIVLLAAMNTDRYQLAAAVAPGLSMIGFMLPYTPLHLLLFEDLDRPLVMTSGNRSDEPQITGNEEALEKLRDIADVWILHDREIANRIDDSVVRVVSNRPRLQRRARGYAPSAIALPPGFEGAPDLLSYGGELKATFCLVKDGAAILSQHQGDLEESATFDDYLKNLDLYTSIYDHAPRALAADLHPDYLSSRLARETSERKGLPLFAVQHHHAHAAACMAENGIPLDAGPVLAVTLDGLGLGEDGTLWGGEVLLADYRSYRRLGALRPVAMPGGAQAVREPWRNTYAQIAAAMGWETFTRRFPDSRLARYLESKPIDVLGTMIARNIQSPLASSCGRLFDAVAAALGLCADRALHEAQGAMELEAAAARCSPGAEGAYPFDLSTGKDTNCLHLDPAPMWTALIEDLDSGVPLPEMACRFHEGLARGMARMVSLLKDRFPAVTAVVLSGGCFQNAILLARMEDLLGAQGLACLSHGRVPTNDGGLSLGQAVVAAARSLMTQGGEGREYTGYMPRMRR